MTGGGCVRRNSPRNLIRRSNLNCVSRNGPIEVRLCFRPSLSSDRFSQCSTSEIGAAEVCASILLRDARFVCCISERLPAQRNWMRRRDSRLDFRTACGKSHGIAEAVASGEELQNGSRSRAVCTRLGDIFREWRRRRSCWLVGNPFAAIHLDRSLARSAPGADGLAVKQERNRGDRTN